MRALSDLFWVFVLPLMMLVGSTIAAIVLSKGAILPNLLG